MTVRRMEHVGIVVNDLAAATAFFAELGLEPEGEGSVGGEWVDRIVGLDGIRVDISMLKSPDGHCGVELVKFHSPPAEDGDPEGPRPRRHHPRVDRGDRLRHPRRLELPHSHRRRRRSDPDQEKA